MSMTILACGCSFDEIGRVLCCETQNNLRLCDEGLAQQKHAERLVRLTLATLDVEHARAHAASATTVDRLAEAGDHMTTYGCGCVNFDYGFSIRTQPCLMAQAITSARARLGDVERHLNEYRCTLDALHRVHTEKQAGRVTRADGTDVVASTTRDDDSSALVPPHRNETSSE